LSRIMTFCMDFAAKYEQIDDEKFTLIWDEGLQ